MTNPSTYQPNSDQAYTLNRQDIHLFLSSPRLFYHKHRSGVILPDTSPSNFEITVKKLLRKEFNVHRADQSKHPIMQSYGIDAKPFQHSQLEQWREDYHGLQTFHGPTNLILSGKVDDVWHNPKGELIVVEFKTDSLETSIPTLDNLSMRHKQQMEIYQWILKQKGHQVSDTCYFIFAYGRHDKKALDAKLEIHLKLLAYQGDCTWVEPTLLDIKTCLDSPTPPPQPDTSPFYSFYLQLKQAEHQQSPS